jgi:hypothetical protein
MVATETPPRERTDQQSFVFDCTVELPGWRIHIAHLRLWEERDRGNVMDVAVKGAWAQLLRSHPGRGLEQAGTVEMVRRGLKEVGLDPAAVCPASEALLAGFLEAGEMSRGSLAWEFFSVLTVKSEAPWSVVARSSLRPPLTFRAGRPGETLASRGRPFDCEGLPVLADETGVLASPWTLGSPSDLEGCTEAVFVCYLPRDLFRAIEPKTHLGRLVWLTWAYRFVFERTYSHTG